MQFLGVDWVWSITAVAVIWFALIAVISLIESRWNVAECLDDWRFALFEGLEYLKRRFVGSEEKPDTGATARQLSAVLQIPLIDAELSLELSGAFFHPTDDAELNGEAVELLFAPTPRNESWRAQASECCRSLRTRSPSGQRER
jgi:hypothetical protein